MIPVGAAAELNEAKWSRGGSDEGVELGLEKMFTSLKWGNVSILSETSEETYNNCFAKLEDCSESKILRLHLYKECSSTFLEKSLSFYEASLLSFTWDEMVFIGYNYNRATKTKYVIVLENPLIEFNFNPYLKQKFSRKNIEELLKKHNI
jgi:hypothetical protein